MKDVYKSGIIIFLILFVSGFSASQATELPDEKGILDLKVHLRLEEVSLEQVLDKIAMATEIEFLYSPQRIDSDRKITVNANNESLGNLLTRILARLNIGYELVEGTNQILLFHIQKVNQLSASIHTIKAIPGHLFKVDRTIQGTVTDPDGNPLIGVNIVIKSQPGQGAVTDFDGNYRLEIPEDTVKLIFSYVGYLTQEVTVTNQQVLDIVMKENISRLDEIIVVGYGTQKKSDITGSVAVVDIDKAMTQPTTDFTEMLRGQAPGVRITLNDPRPGGNSNIVIRGNNSILGGNSPLFIVDGVPLDNINDINTEDITSIEILKDASAQAIYGARASNGVVLVTTKRGEEGKLAISYNGYYSNEKLVRNFDLYSGEEWIQLRREAFRTSNAQGEYEPDDFVFTQIQREVMSSKNYVNWEDLVMRNGMISNHNISLSGGTEQTKAYASLGFFDQKGVIPGSDYLRGSARINLDHRISDKLKFQSNIFLTTSNQNIESGTLQWIVLPPVSKAFDENGNIVRYPLGENENSYTNPLWNTRESTNENKSNSMDLNLSGSYDIVNNLTYQLNGTLRRKSTEGGYYYSSLHSSGLADQGRASIWGGLREEYLVENILTYNKEFNQNNHLDITGVQSVNKIKYGYSQTTATSFATDFLGYNGIEFAENILPVERNAFERSLVSFMGRIRYNLYDRYLLTLTARADGSSVFSEANKWGYFPSIALGWKMHHEPFLANIDNLDELKFRASYGSTGNEAIQPYQTLGLASPFLYVFGGQTTAGYLPGTNLPNPNLKWETSTILNFGLDFGFFKNILTGSVEWYTTSTTDLLVDRSVSGTTGYSTSIYNAGETLNKGIEFLLTGHLIRSADWDWTLSTNVSANQNKIVALYDERDEEGNLLDDIGKDRFIGEPINVIYQYAFDGIWQAGDDIENSHMPDAVPGDVRVKDISGPDGIPDNRITADDRVITPEDPDWYGSLSSSLRYKNLEFLAEIYTVQGAMKVNPWLAEFNFGGTLQGSLNGIKMDYYTPENPSDNFPRPRTTTPSNMYSLAVNDASYVRLRTLQLSYRFPGSLIERIGIHNLRLLVSGTNLITWTDYKSYSPEINPGSYPDGKEWTIGLKIDF